MTEPTEKSNVDLGDQGPGGGSASPQHGVPEGAAAARAARARARARATSLGHNVRFDSTVNFSARSMAIGAESEDMMGPILRRKKITSLPLGHDPRHAEFFGGIGSTELTIAEHSERFKQVSVGSQGSAEGRRRTRTPSNNVVGAILRRKQVSLDLLAAENAGFFTPVAAEPIDAMPTAPEDGVVEGAEGGEDAEEEAVEPPVKIFRPLQFSTPRVRRGGGGGGHGNSAAKEEEDASAVLIDEDVRGAMLSQLGHSERLKAQLDSLDSISDSTEFKEILKNIKKTQEEVDSENLVLKTALLGAIDEAVEEEDGVEKAKELDPLKETDAAEVAEDDPDVKRATRADFIWTAILLVVMISLTGIFVGWKTHTNESFSVFGHVGLACSTPCLGHMESQDYFNGHNHFGTGDYIQLGVRIDPNPDHDAFTMFQIVGAETGHEKARVKFGPPSSYEHMYFKEDIKVDFEHPEEHHVINVFSVHADTNFTAMNCTTPCIGDLQSRDFFSGHSSFNSEQTIQLVMQLHPESAPDAHGDYHTTVEIVGVESGEIKAMREFVLPEHYVQNYVPVHENDSGNHDDTETHGEETHGEETRRTRHLSSESEVPTISHMETVFFTATIEADFDNAGEKHVINVYSSHEDVHFDFSLNAYAVTSESPSLTYTAYALRLSSLAGHSVLIAALIMICVYLLILLELIHRTLVAIFGSMVALMFLFIIHRSETESVATIMLHMEWSTLGLLFGMMIIVGELSHTGIFEWVAVRILMASQGSYNKLMILLCALTALASAFLDNVTTMLLVAPVTIDMCSILGVDPRPYLIGEVILSNVGGTATLIGDPPNIIIGSAFDEIGFVDFIIHILPAIFIVCVPCSIGIILYLYRYYMSSTKMPELDIDKLKRTYKIYDEPRLLIAGTAAFFVVLMFFLHPVHHKDTAWIALLGAFVTMTFTNPHDVQDALRNHVEFDTLLFFAGLFVLVEVCATLGLLQAIGNALAGYIETQPEESQLTVAITLILWVSAITSAFLDNIPYTATMIPVVRILAESLPDTLPIKTLAWALSFGACLGGNGTLLGASANIVTAGIATNRGYEISFLNFFYPGMITMICTVAFANLYMLVVYVWI